MKTRLWILIFSLVLPINIYAYHEVIDSRCTDEIKINLRSKSEDIKYKVYKMDTKDVLYKIVFFNIDDGLYILDKSNNKKYTSVNDTILNIKPGTVLTFYVYSLDSTSCNNYNTRIINMEIPYYNIYSTNELCKGHEKYYLCLENANINISEEEFISKMNSYINEINKKDINEEVEDINQDIDDDNVFDIIQFISEYQIIIVVFNVLLFIILELIIIKKRREKRRSIL